MEEVMKANISEDYKMIFNEIRLHLKLLTATDIVALHSQSTILPHCYDIIILTYTLYTPQ